MSVWTWINIQGQTNVWPVVMLQSLHLTSTPQTHLQYTFTFLLFACWTWCVQSMVQSGVRKLSVHPNWFMSRPHCLP